MRALHAGLFVLKEQTIAKRDGIPTLYMKRDTAQLVEYVEEALYDTASGFYVSDNPEVYAAVVANEFEIPYAPSLAEATEKHREGK
jgi:hypothetical protein